MYESNWNDSGQLVPDQVTPASDESPIVDGEASAGISTSLVRYYTVNGINTVYGIFTAPIKVSSYYDIDNESAGNITIVISDQSTYYTNRIIEILTQDVVSEVSNGTQIPITYDLGNGGIISNMLQVNPTGRTYTIFNNGIRIGNYNTEYSSSYLGCSTTAINTTQLGQQEISKTSDRALTINPSSQRYADHSVGLNINSDSSIIKFNGNELVNVGTELTINRTKIFNGAFQVNPNTSNISEGIRISKSTSNQWSFVTVGADPQQTSGTVEGQWIIGHMGNTNQFAIMQASDVATDRGLRISADGNTLTFNGRVL
ncbi:MAG: hypothetical protein EZS28_003625 [Streblomastix strix]|uniref:Uncharacterized protein n=1 Tax=Streblomastix strix TaxID=222440 RepID=A0A5J4X279_9EUKA|nr:MAG: hypothetical protein EZS28_003625 [Streblomastix strix]